jgi:hypothetical protein
MFYNYISDYIIGKEKKRNALYACYKIYFRSLQKCLVFYMISFSSVNFLKFISEEKYLL